MLDRACDYSPRQSGAYINLYVERKIAAIVCPGGGDGDKAVDSVARARPLPSEGPGLCFYQEMDGCAQRGEVIADERGLNVRRQEGFNQCDVGHQGRDARLRDQVNEYVHGVIALERFSELGAARLVELLNFLHEFFHARLENFQLLQRGIHILQVPEFLDDFKVGRRREGLGQPGGIRLCLLLALLHLAIVLGCLRWHAQVFVRVEGVFLGLELRLQVKEVAFFSSCGDVLRFFVLLRQGKLVGLGLFNEADCGNVEPVLWLHSEIGGRQLLAGVRLHLPVVDKLLAVVDQLAVLEHDLVDSAVDNEREDEVAQVEIVQQDRVLGVLQVHLLEVVVEDDDVEEDVHEILELASGLLVDFVGQLQVRFGEWAGLVLRGRNQVMVRLEQLGVLDDEVFPEVLGGGVDQILVLLELRFDGLRELFVEYDLLYHELPVLLVVQIVHLVRECVVGENCVVLLLLGCVACALPRPRRRVHVSRAALFRR